MKLASKIVLGSEVKGSAKELMDLESDHSTPKLTALAEAKDFLCNFLKDGGVPAKKSGISNRTLQRTKCSLQVKALRCGYGQGGSLLWELPHSVPNKPIQCQTQNVAPYDGFGAVCEIPAALGNKDPINLNKRIKTDMS